MINLIASTTTTIQLGHQRMLGVLAEDVAYFIGKQTLIDSPLLLREFEKDFHRTNGILDRMKIPIYRDYQHEAYCAITNMLDSRTFLLQQHASSLTDLGLGGILLEGASGIGKTYFVNQIATQYEKETGKHICRISATTPYSEKEKLLRKAFKEGAVVLAEELNTSFWPNHLLNHFLMGVDEQGHPAENPGFMLIATQNPPSYARLEEDPALRRRLLKMKLEWPPYKAQKPAAASSSGRFFRPITADESSLDEAQRNQGKLAPDA